MKKNRLSFDLFHFVEYFAPVAHWNPSYPNSAFAEFNRFGLYVEVEIFKKERERERERERCNN